MKNKLIPKHQKGYTIQSDNTRVSPIIVESTIPNFTRLNQSKLGKAMLDKTKKENPQFYNKKVIQEAHEARPNSEIVRYEDAEGKTKTSSKVLGMSGADPIGQLYVEGVALNPVFKGLGRATQWGLAKAGNNWARAKILSKTINSNVTSRLNPSPVNYEKLSSKLLPKDPDLLYHQTYGRSKLTDKGLIPGKSNTGDSYLWWKEGSQYGNFPERNVYTIPKDEANIITRGSINHIGPNEIYPLTKEVPLEQLTEYSINPITYGFEKRVFINPTNSYMTQQSNAYDLSKYFQVK